MVTVACQNDMQANSRRAVVANQAFLPAFATAIYHFCASVITVAFYFVGVAFAACDGIAAKEIDG